MKIKANQPIKDLKGEDVKQQDGTVFTIGEALGNILVASEIGGKAKMYLLATELVKNDEVTVDVADFGIIKKTVEATKVYSNLVSGQIAVYLEGIK